MNLIFLDIDNVLNYGYASPIRSNMETYGFAPDLVANLKWIVDSVPNTKIVISSSWRMTRIMADISETVNWRNVLERMLGCTETGGLIIGDIPHTNEYPDDGLDWTDKRGEDIKNWLELYGKMYDVKKFAIIDDNASCGTIPMLFPDEFVNVDAFEVGECLSRRNAEIVIGKLNYEYRTNMQSEK